MVDFVCPAMATETSSPGVAVPCSKIAENPDAVYEYTTKGNLVAVLSNGTAVLGLGNIGPLAGKPVMEGKAVLFNKFAGVESIDLSVDTKDPEEFISCVRALSCTFGGINLEDIKAPECFYIEERLKELWVASEGKPLAFARMLEAEHGIREWEVEE